MDVAPYENDWQFIMSNDIPTCRSLYYPMKGNESEVQYYILDGFILSKNITVNSYEIHDLGFENSDHNLQILSITLN